jgi:hypothetical protein
MAGLGNQKKMLQWGLRYGLAATIMAATLLLIWSGFATVFGKLGQTDPLGNPNSTRIAKAVGTDCCSKKKSPKGESLDYWDFYYYAAKCTAAACS